MYVWRFDIVTGAERAAQVPAKAGALKGKLLSGRGVVLPVDPGYDAARKTYNARFDALHPWAVVYCNAEEDVATCLEVARVLGLPFRVRSGGHSFGGYSSVDDGLVIDVSGLNNIRFDPDRFEMTVGSGAKMKQLGAALGDRRLLPIGGDPVGVAGYVQGGGFGATSRTLGMNSDNVLAVWVMLADTRVVYASKTVNHDLWWAMRGGTGGNFGVLLDVRYGVHAATEQHDWQFAWPLLEAADIDTAAKALAILQDVVLPKAGPGFNAAADIRRWPERNGGEPATLRLFMWGTYFGSKSDLDVLIKPLDDIPGQRPFAQTQSAKMPVLRQSRFVSRLGVPDWRTLVQDFADHANPHSTLTLNAWGGAIGSFPLDDSAFIHRSAEFNLYVTGFWQSLAEEQQMQGYLQRWRDFIAPFWTGGVFQNFADPDCPDYRKSYWGSAFPALLAVKAKYDPAQLFRFAQVIEGPTQPVAGPPLVKQWLARPIEA